MNYQAAGERHGLSENQGAPCGFPSGGGSSCARVGVYQNRSLMRARSRLEKVGIDGLLLALRGAHDGDTTRHDDTAGGDPILPTMDPASLRPSLRLWTANARTHRTTEPPTGRLNPFNSVQENREPNPPGSASLGYCRLSGSCTAILPTGRQNLNKPYHSPGAADLDGLGRVRVGVYQALRLSSPPAPYSRGGPYAKAFFTSSNGASILSAMWAYSVSNSWAVCALSYVRS